MGRACSTVAPKCWRGGEDKSCLMFMFRRRRRGLIKRLLLARLGYDASGAPGVLVDVSGDGSSEEPGRLLLKGLDEPQLQLLVDAVDGGGKQPSDCVLLPYRHQASTNSTPAHVLCCQMWRWPDLVRADELKRLPVCGSANDPVYTCCNPYHWSRLCEPESPPPPYSRFAMEQLRPEDRAPSEIPLLFGDRYSGSVTTSGEGGGFSNGSGEWCRLAYWELAQRVGNQFPVRVPSISVFENEPQGNGLCLATLQNAHLTPSDAVLRTRDKIGHGVILSQESDGVWAYNISSQPIFVNSPTVTADMYSNLNNNSSPSYRSSASLCVYRVSPGHCLCIHDPFRAEPLWRQQYLLGEQQLPPTGPIDPNSIRISFVKGWGPNYTRSEITTCPCWLEVLLAPCR